MGNETPLMILRGSKIRTNEFRPNRVLVFQDRVEDHDPGLIKKSMQTIRMDQIAQVKEDRGLAFTSLTIESTGGGTIHARGLSKSDADQAKQLIGRLTAEARRPVGIPVVLPPPPAAPSTLDQLRQLGELRAAGVLTEAEFGQQKAAILGTPGPPSPSLDHLPPPPPSFDHLPPPPS